MPDWEAEGQRDAQPSATVLVVDDDPMVRLLCRETLEGAGFTVEEAPDGATALAMFESRCPDAVLLDVLMPGMDGFQVCEALRALESGRHVPVLISTGLDDMESIDRAYRAGGTDFVTKPLNWGVLPHRLRYMLRAHQAAQRLRVSEAQLLEAQALARLGRWEWGLGRGPIHWSPEVHQVLGLAPQDLGACYEDVLARVLPEDRPRMEATLERLRTGDTEDASLEYRIRTGDGQLRYLHGRARVHRGEDGRPRCLTGTLQDITERKQAEETLQMLSQAMQQSPASVLITDRLGNIEYVNPKFCAVTGYTPDEVVGQNPSLLKSGSMDDATYRKLWETISSGQEWHGELSNRRKDGTLYWEYASISPVKDQTGNITHFLAVKEDITERKRSEERIRFLAYYDGLTGLPNRVLFQEQTRLALAAAKRDGGQIAVLMLDLDHFKRINDTLGHNSGDDLLCAVARTLDDCVRDTDYLSRVADAERWLVARLGGDEFALLLHRLGDPEAAARVAARLLQCIAAPSTLAGRDVVVTASIGIAVFPHDGNDADSLIKNADAAMYHAKGLGRAGYQFYSRTMNETALERLNLEGRLRGALEKDELMLYYQPKLDLRDGRLVGVEALLRWCDPELGMVSPGLFIPIAEEFGLIGRIGSWVFHEACAQNRRWQQAGLPPVQVAVNVSSRQFSGGALLDDLDAALRASGLEPGHLEIELTEGTIMRATADTQGTLDAIRARGVRVAVDDFGTGYSSLSYLKRFPLDTLKVDQSFVRGVPDDGEDAAITRAIIHMAHSLGLQVVAEGVEEQRQLDFLREEGCDIAQGYLLGRPMPAVELALLLASEARR